MFKNKRAISEIISKIPDNVVYYFFVRCKRTYIHDEFRLQCKKMNW